MHTYAYIYIYVCVFCILYCVLCTPALVFRKLPGEYPFPRMTSGTFPEFPSFQRKKYNCMAFCERHTTPLTLDSCLLWNSATKSDSIYLFASLMGRFGKWVPKVDFINLLDHLWNPQLLVQGQPVQTERPVTRQITWVHGSKHGRRIRVVVVRIDAHQLPGIGHIRPLLKTAENSWSPGETQNGLTSREIARIPTLDIWDMYKFWI